MQIDKNVLIKELPTDERPREKLLRYGAGTLSNAELISILLRTGYANNSAIDVANKILSGSVHGLRCFGEMTVEELCKTKGVGKTKAAQLLAAFEIGKRVVASDLTTRKKITAPKDVVAYCIHDMKLLNREHFNIIMLNTKNEIISYENISIGNLNSSIVHPREVFINAIKKSSASIILVHNHPSGNPNPSKEDDLITKRLVDAGKLIGIEVLDHLVVGDGKYYSYKEANMI